MQRQLIIRPGYDHREADKGQPPEKQYGICSEAWIYIVRGERSAVTLDMMSNRYPPSVNPETMPGDVRRILYGPMVGVLYMHTPDPEGRECDLVPGGKCRGESTYLGARDFWAQYGDPTQPEQSEAFWQALEKELEEPATCESASPPTPSQ